MNEQPDEQFSKRMDRGKNESNQTTQRDSTVWCHVCVTKEPRRFVAVLRRQDGTFGQCSDYARNFTDAERRITYLYVEGNKNPRDPWHYKGSSIEQITFDEFAHQLPEHDYLDWD